MTTRTYTPRQSDIERRWFVVDANGQTLGRLASQVARLLAGKHKPMFATHIDTGDHVIVVNASRIAVGGDKLTTKVYARHSGYPGGFRQETLGDLLARRPEEVIRRAVKGMLPRNKLGVQQLRKLKVYAGAEHPHEAQQPEPMVAGSVAGVLAATNSAASRTAAPASTRDVPATAVETSAIATEDVTTRDTTVKAEAVEVEETAEPAEIAAAGEADATDQAGDTEQANGADETTDTAETTDSTEADGADEAAGGDTRA
jgi:large subunit ribosomal protein L13